MSSRNQVAKNLNDTGVQLYELGYYCESLEYFKDSLTFMLPEQPSDLPIRGDGLNQITLSQGHRAHPIAICNNNHSETVRGLLMRRIPMSTSVPICVLAINANDNKEDQSINDLTPWLIVYNVALVHLQLGSICNAEQLLTIAFSLLLESIDSMFYALYICIQCNLATIKFESGNHEEALEILLETVQIGTEKLGRKELLVASTLNRLGCMLLKIGYQQEAMVAFNDASSIYDTIEVESLRDYANNDKNAAAPVA